MHRFSLILLLALSACATFPELDASIDDAARAAPYPELVPLQPILARANALGTTGRITPASEQAFDARVAGLRARAARLRGPVVDAATRARMRRGISLAALQ